MWKIRKKCDIIIKLIFLLKEVNFTMLYPENLSVNNQGHLCIAGQDTVSLAKEFGTPLYVLNEDKIKSWGQIQTPNTYRIT